MIDKTHEERLACLRNILKGIEAHTGYNNFGWSYTREELEIQASLIPPDAPFSDYSFSFQFLAEQHGSRDQVDQINYYLDEVADINELAVNGVIGQESGPLAKDNSELSVESDPIVGLFVDPYIREIGLVEFTGYEILDYKRAADQHPSLSSNALGKLIDEFDKPNRVKFSHEITQLLNPDHDPDFRSSTTSVLGRQLAYIDDFGLVRDGAAFWEVRLDVGNRILRGGRYVIFGYDSNGIETNITETDYFDLLSRSVVWLEPDEAMAFFEDQEHSMEASEIVAAPSSPSFEDDWSLPRPNDDFRPATGQKTGWIRLAFALGAFAIGLWVFRSLL